MPPGDLHPAPHLGRTAVVVEDPAVCPNDHRLVSPNVSRDFMHCQCPGASGGGHPTWYCWTCGWTVIAAAHRGVRFVEARPGFRTAPWLRTAPPSE